MMKTVLALVLACSLSCSSILCMKSTALEVIDQSLERMAQDKARTTPNFAWLPEKIGMIIKNTDINSTDDLGNTRLHYAAFLTDFSAIKSLLELDADPTKQNNNGQDFLTILQLLIIQEKNVKKSEVLHDSYIQVQKQAAKAIAQKNNKAIPQKGNTPLHQAVLMQNVQLVDDLLSKKNNPNQPNDLGITPLHIAASQSPDNPTILNKLLEHKADPNIKATELGNTPLHVAVRNFGECPPLVSCIGNPLTINRLLKYGANPDIQNNNGDTPINTMLQKLNDLIKEYKFLKNDETTPKQQLDEKFDTLNNAALALFDMIQHSKNINLQDNFGNTPLYHLVILSDSKEPKVKDVLKPLIKTLFLSSPAANPNIQNRDGFTPLHAAVSQQDPELVNFLLEHGANPHIRSYVNPPTVAEFRSGVVPPPNKTPRDMANEIGLPDIAKVLEKAEKRIHAPAQQQQPIQPPIKPKPSQQEPKPAPIQQEPSPVKQEPSPVQTKKTSSALEQALDLLTQNLVTLTDNLLQRTRK